MAPWVAPGIGFRGISAGEVVIIGVAIRAADGRVYALPKPKRHFHLFQEYPELRTVSSRGLLVTRSGQTQGFITDTGAFLDRIQGAAYAREHGQVAALAHPPNLYSEDLW